MQEIYTSPNLMLVHLAQSYLESRGIASEVADTHLNVIAGGIPFMETWPRLFAVEDADGPRARELIAEFTASVKDRELPTFCPKCDAEAIDAVSPGDAFHFSKFRCRACGHAWKKTDPI